MNYKDTAANCVKHYPHMFQREEDVLNQLFLTNGGGYEWNEETGELVEVFPEYSHKHKEASIAWKALDMAKNDGLDRSSYWFDFFMIEHQKKMEGDRFPSSNFNYNYCNLTRIPNTITKEWAEAIVKCAEWIYSTCNNIDIFVKNHFKNYCRFYYGGTDEVYEKMQKENPDKTVYEIKCMYADYIESEVTRRLTKEATELQNAAANAATLCHILHDILAGLTSLARYPIDTSKPSWYVEKEDRDEYKREPYNAKEDKCVLEILRHKQTPEEKALNEKRDVVVDRLIDEILAEEKS